MCIFAEKKLKKVRLTIGQFNAKLCLLDALGCYVGKFAEYGSQGGVSYPVAL